IRLSAHMNQSLKNFKAQRALFFVSELKSWVWTLLIFSTIIIGASLFNPISNDKIEISLLLIVFAKLLTALLESRIRNIDINTDKKTLDIKFRSPFSGEKVKSFELKNVHAEMSDNNPWKRFFDSRFTLNLYMKPKGHFKIGSRYGFS